MTSLQEIAHSLDEAIAMLTDQLRNTYTELERLQIARDRITADGFTLARKRPRRPRGMPPEQAVGIGLVKPEPSKRVLSEESRQRIIEAQRKRWAKKWAEV